MDAYALIFAGGVGARMGGDMPKQFMTVGDAPVIIHVLRHFDSHEGIRAIVVVCKEGYIDLCWEYVRSFELNKVVDVIPGGETGQDSIFKGLDYLIANVSESPHNDIVLVHDGVRPLIDRELITNSIECTSRNGNSIAVSQSIETVIEVDNEGHMLRAIDRASCRNAKAPQCFRLNDIYERHMQARREGMHAFVDSATLMSYYGETLFTTECALDNIKVTTPKDFFMLKGLYEERQLSE